MTTDECGLQSLSDIDPVDLRMSSRQWELQGLTPSGKALDHVSMYGTDLSDEKNVENMYRMFLNLLVEVISNLSPKECQLYMDNTPNSFAQNTSMTNHITKVDLWLYRVGFNNVSLIFRIAVFGLLMNYQDW
jgi:hypothetical protein